MTEKEMVTLAKINYDLTMLRDRLVDEDRIIVTISTKLYRSLVSQVSSSSEIIPIHGGTLYGASVRISSHLGDYEYVVGLHGGEK